MTIALLGVLAFGVEASARQEALVWTHADPATVTGFKVRWNPVGGAATTSNVGLPSRDSAGRYTTSVEVGSGDVQIAMIAYNGAGDSPPSNVICRGTCGATPPPPPPPTAAQSAVTGFKLWDASTDQVLVSNFTGGTVNNGCVAIEILGNAYLTGGAGSVKKQLGSAAVTCNQAGKAYENIAPFAWEDGGNLGAFDCAPSLQASGTYTFTAIPYDGKDCTGAMGTPISVTFTVNAPSTPPPPPPPPPPADLGTPGKPYLVQ